MSVLFNTDGVPVFRSSRFAFWPLYLVICELPYKNRCVFICLYDRSSDFLRTLALIVRFVKENRIFAGLWYGDQKPDMTLFLRPLCEALTRLYNEGTSIFCCVYMHVSAWFRNTAITLPFLVLVGVTISPPDAQSFTCRVALLAATFDLPARAAVMNFVQFNGYYGCSHCLQEGTCMVHVQVLTCIVPELHLGLCLSL